jgi:hypothetical protein
MQRKNQIDGAQYDNADSRGPRPLNRYAPENLDRSRNVYENLTVMNVTNRLDLLPVADVTPDQSDDAKGDRGQSIHVASEIASRHLSPEYAAVSLN